MAAFNKFNAVAALPWNGGIALGGDTVKVMLTNVAPVVTNALYGDVSAGDLATANGYTNGGATLTLTSSSQTSGLWKGIWAAGSPTWSATGAVGPFRYVIVYDFTATSPLKPLLGWWDYGSSVSLANGDTFTVQLDAVNGMLQMS